MACIGKEADLSALYGDLEMDEPPLVVIIDGRIFADSRIVAKKFEKRHADVLRAIRDLDCSEDFRQRNFAQSCRLSLKINDLNDERTSHYMMTRDGFSFLAFGFTGNMAAEFKEKYITAFNTMERKLRFGGFDIPETKADALRLAADALERAGAAEKQIEADEPKVKFFESFMNADGLFGLQNAARALGCRPNLFIRWLKQRYLFYQGSHLVARIQYIQIGIFEMKTSVVDNVAHPQAYVTPKGLEYFAKRVPRSIQSYELVKC